MSRRLNKASGKRAGRTKAPAPEPRETLSGRVMREQIKLLSPVFGHDQCPTDLIGTLAESIVALTENWEDNPDKLMLTGQQAMVTWHLGCEIVRRARQLKEDINDQVYRRGVTFGAEGFLAACYRQMRPEARRKAVFAMAELVGLPATKAEEVWAREKKEGSLSLLDDENKDNAEAAA